MRNWIAGVLIFWASTLSAQGDGDPVFNFSASDATMNTAIKTAIATLPRFFENAVDDEGFGVPGANLKVAFDVVNEGESQKEIIWVSPFKRFEDGSFVGLLANQPNFMPGLTQGDQVDFDLSMVRDWSLWTRENTSYGNFTTRVIAVQMGDQGRDLLDRMITPAVPQDWTQ